MPAHTDLPAPHLAEKSGEARLSSNVHNQILALIASGAFPLNSRLPAESVLAQRFGASRPVIREALARLRDDGLIVSRQGSGSYVRRRPDMPAPRFGPVISVEDVERRFEFRVGVEGAAAALAAVRAHPEDIADIRQVHAAMERHATSGDACLARNNDFHRAIAQATRNAYHLAIQASLQADHDPPGGTAPWSEARLWLVREEHLAILEAIEARDSLRARAAMEIHLNNARDRLLADIAAA